MVEGKGKGRGLGLYFLGRVETLAYVVFFVTHAIHHLDYRKKTAPNPDTKTKTNINDRYKDEDKHK